jgi:hypothetical protein
MIPAENGLVLAAVGAALSFVVALAVDISNEYTSFAVCIC